MPCSCSSDHTGNRGNIPHSATMYNHCQLSTGRCQYREDSQNGEIQKSDDPDIFRGKPHEDNLHEDLSETLPLSSDFPPSKLIKTTGKLYLAVIPDLKQHLQALLAYDFTDSDGDNLPPGTFKDKPHSIGVFRHLLEELGFSLYTAYLGGELVITLSAALLSFFTQFEACLQKQTKYYMLTVLIPKYREILKGMGFRFESNCSFYVKSFRF